MLRPPEAPGEVADTGPRHRDRDPSDKVHDLQGVEDQDQGRLHHRAASRVSDSSVNGYELAGQHLQPRRGDREVGGRGEGSSGGDPGVQTGAAPEEGRRVDHGTWTSMRTGGVVMISVGIAGLMRMP